MADKLEQEGLKLWARLKAKHKTKRAEAEKNRKPGEPPINYLGRPETEVENELRAYKGFQDLMAEEEGAEKAIARTSRLREKVKKAGGTMRTGDWDSKVRQGY